LLGGLLVGDGRHVVARSPLFLTADGAVDDGVDDRAEAMVVRPGVGCDVRVLPSGLCPRHATTSKYLDIKLLAMLTIMVGLKRVRETVDTAAVKVTASAETIARSIGVAIGLAVVALVVALVAVVVTVKHSHMQRVVLSS
jgi:hypothetical protein